MSTVLTSAPVDVEVALRKDGLDLGLAKNLLQVPGDDVVLLVGCQRRHGVE